MAIENLKKELDFRTLEYWLWIFGYILPAKKEKKKGLCETDLCPEWATAVTDRPKSNGSDAACSANGLLSEPLNLFQPLVRSNPDQHNRALPRVQSLHITPGDPSSRTSRLPACPPARPPARCPRRSLQLS